MAIGVFDSGYGGLTILKEIRKLLPEYDYIYLGDNARTPYGSRSFDIVYEFTLQAVKELFNRECPLVVLACNTASAKALRTIQQRDLPTLNPSNRVLGIIRPTVEAIPSVTETKHIGLLATPGTVASHSYRLELEKMDSGMVISELPCPMLVPIVENNESDSPGADYFVEKYIGQLLCHDPEIDTVILGCTHYPMLLGKIRKHIPPHIRIISQGEIIAASLASYLKRHPEIERRCGKSGKMEYLTTENPEKFNGMASVFLGYTVAAAKTILK